ncbi:hypothetical protein BCU66_010525 [Vibrio sp. 10N.286.49.B1]|uniref:hypothetical protein n=1 Tax=unclassified Vibrio TaxID=2614977 RepID=UPI00105606E4|nr:MULTISPECIES: hypothetical protein [unclassified Vibrio]
MSTPFFDVRAAGSPEVKPLSTQQTPSIKHKDTSLEARHLVTSAGAMVEIQRTDKSGNSTDCLMDAKTKQILVCADEK